MDALVWNLEIEVRLMAITTVKYYRQHISPAVTWNWIVQSSNKFCLSLFVLRYIIFTLIDNLRGVKRETMKMLGEWNSFSLSAIRDSISIYQHVFVICFFTLLWQHKLYQRSLPTMFFTTLIMLWTLFRRMLSIKSFNILPPLLAVYDISIF